VQALVKRNINLYERDYFGDIPIDVARRIKKLIQKFDDRKEDVRNLDKIIAILNEGMEKSAWRNNGYCLLKSSQRSISKINGIVCGPLRTLAAVSFAAIVGAVTN